MENAPLGAANDTRLCKMCGVGGDTGIAERLLYSRDHDAWMHVNCMLWSAEVYESDQGELMAVDTALIRSQRLVRVACHRA